MLLFIESMFAALFGYVSEFFTITLLLKNQSLTVLVILPADVKRSWIHLSSFLLSVAVVLPALCCVTW